jgi:hypothetical protein
MSSSPSSPSTVSSSNAGDRAIDYIDLVPSPSFEPEPETSFTGEKRRVVQISSDEEPDTRAKDTHVEEYAPSEHNASSSDTEFDETIKEGAARSKTAHTRSKMHKTRSTRSNSTRQTRSNKRQKVETKIVVSASKLRQPQDPFQRVQPKLAPGCKNAFDLLGRKKKKSRVPNPNSVDSTDQPPPKRPKNEIAEQSSKTASKVDKPKKPPKTAKQAGLRSDAWQWFSADDVGGVRYGTCLIETVEGKPCDMKIRTGTSTTALWRHLKVSHGFSDKGAPSVGWVFV